MLTEMLLSVVENFVHDSCLLTDTGQEEWRDRGLEEALPAEDQGTG